MWSCVRACMLLDKCIFYIYFFTCVGSISASPPEAPSPPYFSADYITLQNVNKRVVYVADVMVAGNLNGPVSFKMHYRHKILPLRPYFDPNRYLSPTVSCHLLVGGDLQKSLTYVVSIRAQNNLGLMSPATQQQWNRHPGKQT